MHILAFLIELAAIVTPVVGIVVELAAVSRTMKVVVRRNGDTA